MAARSSKSAGKTGRTTKKTKGTKKHTTSWKSRLKKKVKTASNRKRATTRKKA